jgi:hypothetical protein
VQRLNNGEYNHRMLFEAGEPPQNPVLLQARVAGLMALLAEQTSAVARLQGKRAARRAERDTFRTERDTATAEIEKLQLIIKAVMRSRYGARSEKLDPDQLQLALEDIAQSLGLAGSVAEAEPAADKQVSSERKPPQRNRGALPAHLPRVEVVIDVEQALPVLRHRNACDRRRTSPRCSTSWRSTRSRWSAARVMGAGAAKAP